MPTFADDYLAIRVLETRLQTVLNSTYEDHYTRYGGVDVKVKTDEDSEPENVGKPLVLLEQESGGRSEWSSVRSEYRDVGVLATTFVSDGSGAQQGAANPITSDEQLSRDLVTEIETNYTAWRDLGLQNIRIASRGLSKAEGEVVRRIGHLISFSYNR